MTRATRLSLAVATLALIAAVAALAWWLDGRARPARVGPRFADGVARRHPGATVRPLDGDVVRIALPSGVYVDVRMAAVFDGCRAARLRCPDIVDDALGDVDRAEAATRAPTVAALRPVVVGEPGGFRYGYVADPLVGPFEVRYALGAGVASTFATATIVDRLKLSRDALRDAARANLRREPDVAVDRIDERAGLFRVRAVGDAPASLLDRDRMTRVATAVGARRLYVAIPARGALVVAAASDASARALEALEQRVRGTDARTVDGGVLAYDVDAPQATALSIAPLSSVLRLP